MDRALERQAEILVFRIPDATAVNLDIASGKGELEYYCPKDHFFLLLLATECLTLNTHKTSWKCVLFLKYFTNEGD